METILQVLMRRDNMDKESALELIAEAKEQMHIYIEEGDMEAAHDICEEYFGLEPDFLMELL